MGTDPQDIDRDLLGIRDRLELRREQDGDHRYDWLLEKVKERISEQARQACVEEEERR